MGNERQEAEGPGSTSFLVDGHGHLGRGCQRQDTRVRGSLAGAVPLALHLTPSLNHHLLISFVTFDQAAALQHTRQKH